MQESEIKKQVKSRQRVADHGEVFTNEREVNAMLDLVKHETENIESRFLEPACGNGNFLIEILKRKLGVVKSRYKRSQLDYERAAVVTISSIYGIDLLLDNVIECRKRLLEIFLIEYKFLFKKNIKNECLQTIDFILSKNIIHGNALTLKQVNDMPIIFSEWSLAVRSMIKRKDYKFTDLQEDTSNTLFSNQELSDIGSKPFIPMPIKDFPLTHFLKLNEHV